MLSDVRRRRLGWHSLQLASVLLVLVPNVWESAKGRYKFVLPAFLWSMFGDTMPRPDTVEYGWVDGSRCPINSNTRRWMPHDAPKDASEVCVGAAGLTTGALFYKPHHHITRTRRFFSVCYNLTHTCPLSGWRYVEYASRSTPLPHPRHRSIWFQWDVDHPNSARGWLLCSRNCQVSGEGTASRRLFSTV